MQNKVQTLRHPVRDRISYTFTGRGAVVVPRSPVAERTIMAEVSPHSVAKRGEGLWGKLASLELLWEIPLVRVYHRRSLGFFRSPCRTMIVFIRSVLLSMRLSWSSYEQYGASITISCHEVHEGLLAILASADRHFDLLTSLEKTKLGWVDAEPMPDTHTWNVDFSSKEGWPCRVMCVSTDPPRWRHRISVLMASWN
nr:hypothetical protein CFP56_50344 [Quercus suber]